MTVGPTHPTVSESSRLQSLEQAVVTLRRILVEQQTAIEELVQEIERVDDMAVYSQDAISELAVRLDSLSGSNSKQ